MMDQTPDDDMIETLRVRFARHMNRHEGVTWAMVEARLRAHPSRLASLTDMERTGGEPDVTGFDHHLDRVVFCDCSAESPVGRRSLCFDKAALDARKKDKPAGNAVDMALAMGVDLLTEADYRHLQTLGRFDTRTSSWISTPAEIRRLGGALFCDRRYDHVFVYHNGADSYYAARGFRARLLV